MPKVTAKADLDDARALYAAMLQAVSGSNDARIGRAFETVPREAFLPPGPWQLMVLGYLSDRPRAVRTPTADPIHLYHNALIALDGDKGINNGEPHLHATWFGAIAPQPGETVTHIGAGAGYYTAILSMLVLMDGTVTAYEVDDRLAQDAQRNLAPFDNATVRHANAVLAELPASDLIYVNAGVVAPPKHWLEALKPGGRMIFPWRPTPQVALAAVVTRSPAGFVFKPLMRAWFIPCVGVDQASADSILPDHDGAWRTKSVRLTSNEAPDASATAILGDLWFSDQPSNSAV